MLTRIYWKLYSYCISTRITYTTRWIWFRSYKRLNLCILETTLLLHFNSYHLYCSLNMVSYIGYYTPTVFQLVSLTYACTSLTIDWFRSYKRLNPCILDTILLLHFNSYHLYYSLNMVRSYKRLNPCILDTILLLYFNSYHLYYSLNMVPFI